MGKIKNKIISLAAACLFAVGLLPSAVSADDAPILFVNGKDIIAAENNTVQCGTGKAVYDAATHTLTLDNAQITEHTKDGDIPTTGRGAIYAMYTPLNIVLVGDNSIDIDGDNYQYAYGIYVWEQNLTISSENKGSLTIASNNRTIEAQGKVTIDNVSLDLTAAKADCDGMGGESFEIKSSDIKLRSDSWGIYSENDFNVSDSKFDIQSPINNIMVDEGKLTASNTKFYVKNTVSGCAIYAGKDITIENGSYVEAESEPDCAIFTPGNIKLDNSEFHLKGLYPGVMSSGDMEIKDSKVESKSTDDIGIWSRSNLTIIGNSEVKSNGIGAAGEFAIEPADGSYADVSADGNKSLAKTRIIMEEVRDDFYYKIHEHALSWVIDKEPTVDEEGIKHEECSTCDYKGEAVPIDKLTPDTPSGDKPSDDKPSDDKPSDDIPPATGNNPGTVIWIAAIAVCGAAVTITSACRYKKEKR